MIIGRILPREVTPPTAKSVKEAKHKEENSAFEDALVTSLTSAIEKTSEDPDEKAKQETRPDDSEEEFEQEEFVAVPIVTDGATDKTKEIKVRKLNIEA